MKIGLDVMGGDYAPTTTIGGAILAQKELPVSDKIVLIGNQDIILQKLAELNGNPDDFEIIHTSQVIEMGDAPLKAFNTKADSSIAIGLKKLRNREIDTFSSAGNTGAMLVGSIYSVSSIQGVIRPCITSVLPKANGEVGILLDVGTVPDCRPDILYQFGVLGSLFAEFVYKIKNPKVGLLNIGEEEEKGNLATQAAYRLMKDTTDFNFIGNVEGRDLFNEKADVVVCDGFVGNVIIKQAEANYVLLAKRGYLDDFFSRFNYENYGGTPILGINGTVMIGHGISNEKAIKNMLILSKEVELAELSKKIKKAMMRYINEE